MPRQRVYIDASILILASRAKEDEISLRAIAELDRDVDYLYSSIVELETIPRPLVNNFSEQVAMLRGFFELAERIECSDEVQRIALAEACKGKGLDAADALHVGCAIVAGATELVTGEKPESTLPQAQGVTVRSIAVDP